MRILLVAAALTCLVALAGCPGSGADAAPSVEITSEPDSAQLIWFPAQGSEWYGNGAPIEVGTTPTSWTPPGNAASLADAGRLVAWVPGHGRAEVSLSAEVMAAPIALTIPRFGSLRVSSDPISDFTLTGPFGRVRVADERTPYVAEELEPGDYVVSIERAGWAPYEQSVRVMAATEAEHLASLERAPAAAGGDARVDVGWGTFDGTVEPAAFYSAFLPRARELDGCYERALAADPQAGGTIRVRLHINDAFGTVDRVEVLSSDIEHEDAMDCFTRRVGRVELGAGSQGTSTVDLSLYALRLPE